MATRKHERRTRLSVAIEPDLRRRIERAAANQNLSVPDYVVAVLHQATAIDGDDESSTGSTAWPQLAMRSFARDWESAEDAVYDHLS